MPAFHFPPPGNLHTVVKLGALLLEVVVPHRQLRVSRCVQLRYQVEPHGQFMAAVMILNFRFGPWNDTERVGEEGEKWEEDRVRKGPLRSSKVARKSNHVSLSLVTN